MRPASPYGRDFYLRISQHSNFFDDVSALGSFDEYVDYAIEHGQDNLLTRYLSDSVRFLVDPGLVAPDMRIEGARLLECARKALDDYDALIDLADFDAGIFDLAEKLEWKRIPIYRAANRNRNKPADTRLSGSLLRRLQVVLQYDIALYDEFRSGKLGAGFEVNRRSPAYQMFSIRQKGIRLAAMALNKR